MKPILRKITLDEVYISPLKRRRIRREDGSEIMIDVPHDIRPSGSMIMDAVVDVAFRKRRFQVRQIAYALDVDPGRLAGAIHILVGMPMLDFLNAFRLRMAQEYLACTNLTLQQIAERCDWYEHSAFSHAFAKQYGTSPSAYRRRHRPKDFRLLYEW